MLGTQQVVGAVAEDREQDIGRAGTCNVDLPCSALNSSGAFQNTAAAVAQMVFTDGPFSDMIGVVDAIDVDKGRVRVLVSMFGRETPVELDFLQVEKL